MTKKITAFFAIVAVASFSSLAFSGECGDKRGCDRDKSEASAPASFEVAKGGCGGGSCGGKGDGDKA